MIKLIGPSGKTGGVHPLNVSISWIGRDRSNAVDLIGTSRIFFRPLPTRFPGLQMTSIEAILSGDFRCSSWRAFREAMLNPSDPQNRIRSGS